MRHKKAAGIDRMTSIQLQRFKEALQKRYFEQSDNAEKGKKGSSRKVALAQLSGLQLAVKMGTNGRLQISANHFDSFYCIATKSSE